MDIVGQIMAYEDGQLEQDEIVALFDRLVQTGMIAGLQGSYQRMAERLIADGLIAPAPCCVT